MEFKLQIGVSFLHAPHICVFVFIKPSQEHTFCSKRCLYHFVLWLHFPYCCVFLFRNPSQENTCSKRCLYHLVFWLHLPYFCVFVFRKPNVCSRGTVSLTSTRVASAHIVDYRSVCRLV